jgi:hypothetical protein
MRMRVGVLALSVLLSAGCGKIKEVNSDGGPEADAGPEVDAAPPDPCAAGSEPTFDEGIACISNAFCGLFSRCFAPFEEGQCETATLFSPLGENSAFAQHAVKEAIEAGLVEYDPAGVIQCVEFMEGLSCAELNEVPGELLDFCPFLSGTVADGDDCVVDFECATPHALCSEPTKCPDGDVCCVKGCVAPVALSEVCSEDEIPCEPGAYCVNNIKNTICASGDVDALCDFDSDCEVANYCNDELGRCQAEVASGAACAQDEQCPGPEVCLGNDLSGGPGTGTCGRSDREGDMCDGDCFGLQCQQVDNATMGTCIPFLTEEGADCSELECSGAAWECDEAADQCVPLRNVGEPCGNTSITQCRFGLFCTNDITDEPEGICSGRLADGERCQFDSHCQSGICQGEPLTCQPYPGCYE